MQSVNHLRYRLLRLSACLLLLVLLHCHVTLAQALSGATYRITYDNDQFLGTDRYYTGGLRQSFGTEHLRFGLMYALYTPTEVLDAEPRYHDRPYAATAVASLQHHHFGRDTSSYWIVEGSVGLIGNRVGGEQTQRFVHRMVGVREPRGWAYQIANDVLAGAKLSYVRQVCRYSHAEVDASGEAELGTHQTRVGADVQTRVGWPQLKLQMRASTYLPIYDATLQGSAFSRAESPVRHEYAALTPVVGRVETGVWARLGRVSGFASYVLLTRELMSGSAHRWLSCGGEIHF